MKTWWAHARGAPPPPGSYAYEMHISISNYVGMLTAELTPNDSVIPQPKGKSVKL